MYFAIILLGLLCILLAILLSINYKEEMSNFELARRAEANPKYKDQLYFSKIYPGIKILVVVLALILVITITSLTYANWQSVGALIAFGVIVLSYLLGRSLRRVTADLIRGNMAWFNKYFFWAEILGQISLNFNKPQIHSRQELTHIIEESDFMSEADKGLVAGVLGISDINAKDIMVPRKEIVFVRQDDTISPKMLDELHSTGKRFFPVVDGDWSSVVGTLYLDDVITLSLADSKLSDVSRPSLPILTEEMKLIEVLEEMAKQHAVAILLRNKKNQITGMLTLSQILSKLENK